MLHGAWKQNKAQQTSSSQGSKTVLFFYSLSLSFCIIHRAVRLRKSVLCFSLSLLCFSFPPRFGSSCESFWYYSVLKFVHICNTCTLLLIYMTCLYWLKHVCASSWTMHVISHFHFQNRYVVLFTLYFLGWPLKTHNIWNSSHVSFLTVRLRRCENASFKCQHSFPSLLGMCVPKLKDEWDGEKKSFATAWMRNLSLKQEWEMLSLWATCTLRAISLPRAPLKVPIPSQFLFFKSVKHVLLKMSPCMWGWLYCLKTRPTRMTDSSLDVKGFIQS